MLRIRSKNASVSQGQFDSISQKFSIPADYKVHFTNNVFSQVNPVLGQAICKKSGKTVAFVCFVDSGVLNQHENLSARIKQYAETFSSIDLLTGPIPVPGGEACKNNPAALDGIYKVVMDYGLDRHSCIVVIGGGAVLDFIGYAAATAHRGIRLIRLPTTVLSQNDSGVGVKNGINFMDRKNFLGTFSPPDAVICDFDFLSSLTERDKRAGMAEAIKVSLIRDADFFDWQEKNAIGLVEFDMSAVAYSIKRSAQIHARQISSGGDPFEKGNSRPLDYGHWLAHKLETMSGYEVRHGEAVAIGMLVDARYSYETGQLQENELIRIKNLIIDLGFCVWHSVLDNKDQFGRLIVLEGLNEFREHLGGELSITLLKKIGVGYDVNHIDLSKMEKSLEWFKNLEK